MNYMDSVFLMTLIAFGSHTHMEKNPVTSCTARNLVNFTHELCCLSVVCIQVVIWDACQKVYSSTVWLRQLH